MVDSYLQYPSASPLLPSQGPEAVISDNLYWQGRQSYRQADSMLNERYTASSLWDPHQASIHRPVFQSEYGQYNWPIQPNSLPLAYPPTYPIYQAPIYYPTPYVAPTSTHPLYPQSYIAPSKVFSTPLPDSELPAGASHKSPSTKFYGKAKSRQGFPVVITAANLE